MTDYPPLTTTKRLGLRESLEDYARRLNISPAKARGFWRLEGLCLLLVEQPDEWNVTASLVRIAPGVAIPVGPEPCDVIVIEEDETDEQSSATEDNNW